MSPLSASWTLGFMASPPDRGTLNTGRGPTTRGTTPTLRPIKARLYLLPSGGSRRPSASEPAHVARRPARGGDVALRHVVHHHPVGVEPPAERPDRFLHAGDPATREPVVVAVVVERDHLLRE